MNEQNNKSEIILYQTDDGTTKIDVRLSDNTVWLSLNELSELFQRDKSVISRHIKNIYEEAELKEDSTVANFATVQNEGGRSIARLITYYNLDVIISVGYRVKSLRGTQFRIWATERLREYLIKGFTMNDDLWKEDFLTEIRNDKKTIKIYTDTYLITAVPFYNYNNENEFKKTLEDTLN